jgi:plasmid replication initiation protein
MANIPSSLNIVQSYLLSSSKYDFSVHEKRILYRIVQEAQKYIEGKKLDPDFELPTDLFGGKMITVPVKSMLRESEELEKEDTFYKTLNTNHSIVVKALSDLRGKDVIVNQPQEDGTPRVLIDGIIRNAVYFQKDKVKYAQITVPEVVWSAILDFSKGHSKYLLQTTFQLKSKYSMRLAELLSSSGPVTYTISEIRAMLSLEDKYLRFTDFKKRILDPTQKELNESHTHSFDYKVNKRGVTPYSISFTPYKIPENYPEKLEQDELKRQLSIHYLVPKRIQDVLKNHYGFKTRELKMYSELLEDCAKAFDLSTVLSKNKRKASDIENPIGLIVHILRSELEKSKDQKNS